MQDNEILQQIRRVRDEHARECGYDVRELFSRMRADTERLKAEGWKVCDLLVEESRMAREASSSEQA